MLSDTGQIITDKNSKITNYYIMCRTKYDTHSIRKNNNSNVLTKSNTGKNILIDTRQIKLIKNFKITNKSCVR
jgi:hypothetical protein